MWLWDKDDTAGRSMAPSLLSAVVFIPLCRHLRAMAGPVVARRVKGIFP